MMNTANAVEDPVGQATADTEAFLRALRSSLETVPDKEARA